MASPNNFRALTVLVAMMAAALVAVMEGHEPASAQVPCAGCDEPPPVPLPGDTTPLTVISTVPADGATNVDRDIIIKAKFSEAMDKSSINFDTFRLYEGHLTTGDGQIDFIDCPGTETCPPPPPPFPELASMNYKKKTGKLNPSDRLKANTEYTAVIEGAADGDSFGAVKDKAGNEMAKDYIWHFTTGAR